MRYRLFLLLATFSTACQPSPHPFTTILTRNGSCWIYHRDRQPGSNRIYSYCMRFSAAGTFATHYFDEQGLGDELLPVDGENLFAGKWQFRARDQTLLLGEGRNPYVVLRYSPDTLVLQSPQGNQVFFVRQQ